MKFKKITPFSDRSAFSLIEVLIACSILTLISFFLIQAMLHIHHTARQTEERFHVLQWVESKTALLRYETIAPEQSSLSQVLLEEGNLPPAANGLDSPFHYRIYRYPLSSTTAQPESRYHEYHLDVIGQLPNPLNFQRDWIQRRDA